MSLAHLLAESLITGLLGLLIYAIAENIRLAWKAL